MRAIDFVSTMYNEKQIKSMFLLHFFEFCWNLLVNLWADHIVIIQEVEEELEDPNKVLGCWGHQLLHRDGVRKTILLQELECKREDKILKENWS